MKRSVTIQMSILKSNLKKLIKKQIELFVLISKRSTSQNAQAYILAVIIKGCKDKQDLSDMSLFLFVLSFTYYNKRHASQPWYS